MLAGEVHTAAQGVMMGLVALRPDLASRLQRRLTQYYPDGRLTDASGFSLAAAVEQAEKRGTLVVVDDAVLKRVPDKASRDALRAELYRTRFEMTAAAPPVALDALAAGKLGQDLRATELRLSDAELQAKSGNGERGAAAAIEAAQLREKVAELRYQPSGSRAEAFSALSVRGGPIRG